MSTIYEIVFSVDEATHWTPSNISPEDDVEVSRYYKLLKEEQAGETQYYIETIHGKKMYEDQLKKKGDFIVL